MQGKILGLLNFLLILVCGACIYFLATDTYVTPPELQSRTEIDETSYKPNAPTPVQTPKPAAYPNLAKKDPFQPLYSPTPTPTPPPEPTPPPADLGTAVFKWNLIGIEDNKATFEMNDTKEQFEMTVGGAPRDAADQANRPLQVSLASVDPDQGRVILSYQGQNIPKSLQ